MPGARQELLSLLSFIYFPSLQAPPDLCPVATFLPTCNYQQLPITQPPNCREIRETVGSWGSITPSQRCVPNQRVAGMGEILPSGANPCGLNPVTPFLCSDSFCVLALVSGRFSSQDLRTNFWFSESKSLSLGTQREKSPLFPACT